MYTLPYTGTYNFRVLANSASLGNYIVYTGFDSPDPGDEVARDTRDVVLQYSDDGLTWSNRAVVNDDAPLYDNAFPEVAVDAFGQVFVDWYDHRNDPLGIGTDIYAASSGTGGVAFAPSSQLNDGGMINWSLVSSNLAPNMGDYSALLAEGCNVYACFADGRQGSPDTWVQSISDCATPTQLALARVDAQPDHVDLTWYATGAGALSADVQRRESGGEWTTVGGATADGSGMVFFHDADVRSGTTYEYRLGIAGTSGTEYFGSTSVLVPLGTRLAVQASRAPAGEGLLVTFTLAHATPASIEVFDVVGRVVATARVSASGQATLGSHLKTGIYMVKLSQDGRSAIGKAALVR